MAPAAGAGRTRPQAPASTAANTAAAVIGIGRLAAFRATWYHTANNANATITAGNAQNASNASSSDAST